MDFLYRTTFDGIIIDANEAASRISGYTLDELKQMDILELYAYPATRDRVAEIQPLVFFKAG